MTEKEESIPPAVGVPPGPSALAAALFAALVLPGLGHVLLRRRWRGLWYFLIVATCLLVGVSLDGNLHRVLPGQPLTILATLGSMGLGLPYVALRFGLGYQGDVIGAGYEYGSAFILTAGLMNILLVLDVLDIARGRKA